MKTETTIPAKTVHLMGAECVIRFAQYDNGAVFMEALKVDTLEPWLTISVNWQDHWKGKLEDYPKFPFVVVKDYSENQGVCARLAAQRVFTDMGTPMPRTNLSVRIMMLSEDWQRFANPLIPVTVEYVPDHYEVYDLDGDIIESCIYDSEQLQRFLERNNYTTDLSHLLTEDEVKQNEQVYEKAI